MAETIAPETDEAPAEEASAEETSAAEAAAAADAAGEERRSPLLQAIREPIAGDAPAGEKVTYDDDFQQLKGQINSLESATGATDFEQVVTLGEKILTEKSKDLSTVCYMALGLARQQGAEGVAEGLGAARVLVDVFWEDLYPAQRRMAGRRNALQFLADRLKEELLRFDDPVEADREPLRRAQEDLEALQAFCMEEMGEHAPAFSGIKSALEKVIGRLPEPEPDEPEEEAEAQGPSASGAAPAGPGELQSAADAQQAVTRAAAFLREQGEEPNPVPYRLLRVLRWGILQQAPPHENGQTRIDPPLEQRRTYLSGLLEQGEHETLVAEAEASFQNSPFHFWLDLQRLLAAALDAQGEAWAPVHEAVLEETALLVHRLPELPALAFRDGTPFADPLTRDWIDAQVRSLRSANSAAPQNGTAAEGEAGAALDEQYRAARQQLGSGDLPGALAAMREGEAQDASAEERFRRRLYVAELCVKGQHPAVARPLLEHLDADVERHALDDWDPPLALQVWTNLHACYRALVRTAPQAQKQTLTEAAQVVFEKICRLDAARALSMGGS